VRAKGERTAEGLFAPHRTTRATRSNTHRHGGNAPTLLFVAYPQNKAVTFFFRNKLKQWHTSRRGERENVCGKCRCSARVPLLHPFCFCFTPNPHFGSVTDASAPATSRTLSKMRTVVSLETSSQRTKHQRCENSHSLQCSAVSLHKAIRRREKLPHVKPRDYSPQHTVVAVQPVPHHTEHIERHDQGFHPKGTLHTKGSLTRRY